MKKINILIADDDENILYAFSQFLEKDGYNGIIANDGEEALQKAKTCDPDVIFLDFTMPKFDGLQVLEKLRNEKSSVPIIIITGFGTMHTTIKAIQLGAFEYLTKPLDLKKVRDTIKRAVASTNVKIFKPNEIYDFREEIHNRFEIIGNSSPMQEVYKLIGSISTTPNHTPVLILGESGTGKELVARAIHNNSKNSAHPFVAINCMALPENLLESELFGYEKGAFTGAIERKFGKFELAGEGTIFLDEIGGLSLNLQQKLLRVLQNREFERLGGNETHPVSARFIAATNSNLEHEVKTGNFREDLFYRLNVASVNLVPLRERKEDIFPLASFFLQKSNYLLKKNIKGLSEESLNLLENYDYPGNVRELSNSIERAVMLAKGEVLLSSDFSDLITKNGSHFDPFEISTNNFADAKEIFLDKFEKKFIDKLLKETSGNIAKAAEISGMTRQNFQRLVSKHEIEINHYRK